MLFDPASCNCRTCSLFFVLLIFLPTCTLYFEVATGYLKFRSGYSWFYFSFQVTQFFVLIFMISFLSVFILNLLSILGTNLSRHCVRFGIPTITGSSRVSCDPPTFEGGFVHRPGDTCNFTCHQSEKI